MNRMQHAAIYARTETALSMGTRLTDVYALAVRLEDAAEEANTSHEDKADAEAATVPPPRKS